MYFSELLSLQEVLLLESIYYIAVVILEVPTGYFSDAFGRRTTLILASVSLCFACVAFIVAGSFWMLALGQIGFAMHMSFLSGTNTVFHYESLLATGQEGEYGNREARVNKYGMLAGGTAALLGGLLGHWGLHFAYVATMVAAVISLLIALKFKEPTRIKATQGAFSNMATQLTSTVAHLKKAPLGWIAAYYIIIYTISHVPYEFYQPYIKLLEEGDLLMGSSAPLISGLLYAFARYFGAFGAAYSMVWKRKFGLRIHLIIQLLIINFIVMAMSLVLHPILISVVLLRSLPWAAVKAPINEIITPNIDPGQRATFHSMLSLGCRLVFFLTLVGLSFLIPSGEVADWLNLSKILRVCFLSGLVLTVVISLLSGRLRHVRSD